MLVSTTRYPTAHASKYLQTLCKHFGHKVPASYDAQSGEVALSPGPARFTADAEGLDIEVRADDATGVGRAQQVVEDHLKRFAFRESPAPLIWTE